MESTCYFYANILSFRNFIFSGFYLVIFKLQDALAYAEGTDAMKVA